jgi:heptosyltransferase-2
VVITGMPSDKEAAQFLKDSTGDRVIDATGALSLREFFGLLSLCTAFVANDSGAMHAASAAGAPVVGIFGSTSPDATHPVSGMYKIVKRDISCSPCFERECRFGHYQCLTEIQPEDVFEAMREFL